MNLGSKFPKFALTFIEIPPEYTMEDALNFLLILENHSANNTEQLCDW